MSALNNRESELHQFNLFKGALFDKDGSPIHFRTITKNKPNYQFDSTNLNYLDSFSQLNNAEYELFVQVNQSDGKGQKTENITAVRALFVDFDNPATALDVIETLTLLPTVIVNSSQGKFHVYYKVTDCTLGQFKGLQKSLAQKLGGDEAVSDLPRIMRAPGSYNRKGSKPYFVCVTEVNDVEYSTTEIIEGFDLESFGSFGSGQSADIQEKNYSEGISLGRAVVNVLNGVQLHDSQLAIASNLARLSLPATATSRFLSEIFNNSDATRDQRFDERIGDIVRTVSDAYRYANKPMAPDVIETVQEWPEPEPLAIKLHKVSTLPIKGLPSVIRDLVIDESERIGCATDYVAVSLLSVIGSLTARTYSIQPKLEDTGWEVIPNLWGIVIGPPSAKKSPSMGLATKAIWRIQKVFYEECEAYKRDQEVNKELDNMRENANKLQAKKLVKEGDFSAAKAILDVDLKASEPHILQRVVVGDSTTEKLGEIANENEAGFLLYRDELSGFLKTLDKPDKVNDRSFYLEAFNGDSTYVYDRIGRGTIIIPTLRISILGSIQPAVLKTLLVQSSLDGSNSDGLLQRFQLAVYPDPIKSKIVDRAPNKAAQFQLDLLLKFLMNPSSANSCLKFSQVAYDKYIEWLEHNQKIIESDETHHSLQAHFIKYNALVPKIACIYHVVDSLAQNVSGEISLAVCTRAIEYVEYLRVHAIRIYGLGIATDMANAETILQRINKLPSPFTIRDIRRKGWIGLSTNNHIAEALTTLLEYGHIRQSQELNKTGRPTIFYHKHPIYELPKLPKVIGSDNKSLTNILNPMNEVSA
jgi:hypothetical protein